MKKSPLPRISLFMGINSTAPRRVSSTSADTTLFDLHNGDKALRHVAMVAIFLDLNNPRSCKYGRKKKRKNALCDFPVHGCTREQNGSPYFSSIVWRLCQERLLRSRNFATIITWRDISPLFSSDYNGPYPIHASNKTGRHVELLIYDVIRGKTSAAIFEFWLAWEYLVRTRGKVRPLWIALFHYFPV